MNKRSIATVSLSGALDEKLRAIAAAGFDAVEIFENDLLSFNGRPRDVGQMCRDLGLSICAFQPFRDFEGMPEPQRARNFARAERKFDLMQELQTDRAALMKEAVRANVRASASHLRHGSRILEELVSNGDLVVANAEYDLETGAVSFFDSALGGE